MRSSGPRRRLRLLSCALMCGAVVVLTGPVAGAKSFTLPAASIEIRVLSDGSVDISESITYDFDGSFEGAWRDIPSRFGEQVGHDTVRVSSAGVTYSPGGTTTLGTPGPENSFAVGAQDGGTRIVWRYRAQNEQRTFVVSYRMTGLIRVHNDTAELNVRVWGDQWETGLGQLSAQVRLPRPATDPERLRVWGAPREVEGSVTRHDDLAGVDLRAAGIGPQQWVEVRVLFPLEVLDSFDGATESAPERSFFRESPTDSAFEAILAKEGALDEEAQRRAAQRARLAGMLPWLVPLALVGMVGPAIGTFLFVGRRHGRDRHPDAPDYVREPPSEDSPALVGALEREGGQIGTPEFLATFFDLIRKKYFRAEHETTERSTWMGLRSEIISDLRIRPGEKGSADLEPWDRQVYDAVAWAIPSEGVLASELGEVLKGKSRTFYDDFQGWRKAVKTEVRSRGWIDKTGRGMWMGSIGMFFVLFVVGFIIILLQLRSSDTIPVLGLAAALPGATNGIMLTLLGAAIPKALTRRSSGGAELAAGWEGLRRYLDDFSMMREAPPASLILWEQLLVYGIVLGVADKVLEAAQIAAPVELAQQSDLYWVDGPGTGLGGGLTSLRLTSLFAGVDRAVASGAPRSSSSGFGGGFSGGGGFGGGGGGGGAW